MATPHCESCFSHYIVSPSLLESVKIRPVVSGKFRLTMEEWTEVYLNCLEDELRQNDPHELLLELSNGEQLPNPSQHLLHLPIKGSSGHAQTGSKRPPMLPHPQDLVQPPPKRFMTLSSEQLESLSKPSTPQNSRTVTKWALDNFYSWMRHMNSTANTADKCPESILEDMDPKMLNKWLSAYIAETRKVNSEPYPPATLQSLLSGLLRHMRSIDESRAPNIFASDNPAFKELHYTMDSLYKQVCSDRVGSEKHSAQLFTKEDKNRLWEQGVMGTRSPASLLRAVFFYNGKDFCLRGGEEYRSLKLSQD